MSKASSVPGIRSIRTSLLSVWEMWGNPHVDRDAEEERIAEAFGAPLAVVHHVFCDIDAFKRCHGPHYVPPRDLSKKVTGWAERIQALHGRHGGVREMQVLRAAMDKALETYDFLKPAPMKGDIAELGLPCHIVDSLFAFGSSLVRGPEFALGFKMTQERWLAGQRWRYELWLEEASHYVDLGTVETK